MKIEDVFKQVRRDLDQIGQETWDNNGYSGDFYFKYKTNTTVTKPDNSPKDSDNDGIIDSKDQCPYEYGEFANNGCPKKVIVEDDAASFNMVFVQGGSFKMGSNENDDEKPIHNVKLSSFYIGKYEITQKQWRTIMGTDPSYFKNCDDCPVEQVSWNDVQEFLQKLNQKTGKKYCLPTEAEWEYAARGGNRSSNYTYAGSNSIDNVAWYGINSENKTREVGGRQANDLGLHDMSGNVWEWCNDWYDKNYYESSSENNPTGGTGSRRVIRGGSWFSYPTYCRVAYRYGGTPAYRDNNVGFRVALSQ